MVRVYMVDDVTWYAAESEEDALRKAMEDTGLGRGDFEEDIGYMSDAQMEAFNFVDEERPDVKMNFRQRLEEMVAEGYKFPCFFATSEY